MTDTQNTTAPASLVPEIRPEVWADLEQRYRKLEDTVRREVFEETGLRVKNIRYYKSQPWGFTDTMLSGFYCTLDGSDRITLQESELSEAVWLRRQDIPPRDNDVSLTSEMIEHFRLGLEK